MSQRLPNVLPWEGSDAVVGHGPATTLGFTHSTSTSKAEKEFLKGNRGAHSCTKKLKNQSEKKGRNDRKLGGHPFCGRRAVLPTPPWQSGSPTALLPCPTRLRRKHSSGRPGSLSALLLTQNGVGGVSHLPPSVVAVMRKGILGVQENNRFPAPGPFFLASVLFSHDTESQPRRSMWQLSTL